MIVGCRDSFGIECEISEAFPIVSQRALGYFVIYLGGKPYGVREPDATMLGCSFEEVQVRLGRRGTHRIQFLSDLSAAVVVEGFLDAIYRETPRDSYFGQSKSEFNHAIHAASIQWAPDGDAAFDDGSYILQFDVDDKVRLIAFQNMECPIDTADSVAERWIEGDIFYGILSEWRDLFIADWSDRVHATNPTL